MLDTNIDVFSAFSTVRTSLFARFLAATPRLLPSAGRGRRLHGICRDGGCGLPLYVRQHVRHRLCRQRRLNVCGHWQGRDLDHATAPANNCNPLFTMFGIFLHARNEGSVKQSMVRLIISTVVLSGHFKGLAATGAIT